MKSKIIYLLLCFFLLYSCDYFQEKKRKEEAAQRESVRKEQEAIVKQKAIEEQEAKKQDMKNNIAKYVYIKDNQLFNDTDYTIDEVTFEYFINGEKFGDGSWKTVRKNYIAAHTKMQLSYAEAHTGKITSIKSQALEIY